MEAEGAKGPLVASFARVRVYVSAERTPASERWLLVRNDPGNKLKYALSNAPESEPFGELIRASAARWPIERSFQEDKSELGLDHYEHRSWTAWHRHMRLVFLAHLFLVRRRGRYTKKAPARTLPQARALLEWSLPYRRTQLEYVLQWVRYHQERNHQAYLSHRKRQLKELAAWKDLEVLPKD